MAYILLIIFLPLLLVIWFLGSQLSQIMLEQSETLYLSSLRQAADNINTQLTLMVQLTEAYAADARLAYYTDYAYSHPQDVDLQLEAHAYMQNRLRLPEASSFPIARIVLFAENAALWVSGGYQLPFPWLTQDTLTALTAAPGRGHWATPQRPLLRDEVLIDRVLPIHASVFYSRLLQSDLAPPRTLVSLQMPLGTLTAYLSSLPGNGRLIAADGEVIASLFTAPQEAFAYERFRARVLAGERKFALREDGAHNIFTVLPLTNGWLLVHELPYSQLVGETAQARLFALLFALLVGALCLGLLVFLWRTVARRIRRLVRKIQRFERGDLQRGTPEAPAHAQDELGMLNRHLDDMAGRLQTLLQENYTLGLRQKDFELRALQAQINPHFLYNTLSTIKWMTLSHTGEEIREVTDAMARFYRVSLSKGREIILLSDELSCTESYLKIQRFRTMGHIQVHFDVDEALLDVPIPKLILQPLVENSILHAPVENQPMTLIIRVQEQAEQLCLTVIDDGRGMEKQQAENLLFEAASTDSRGGYGLENVRQRLVLFYGEAVHMAVSSAPGTGTRVTIQIPKALLPGRVEG